MSTACIFKPKIRWDDLFSGWLAKYDIHDAKAPGPNDRVLTHCGTWMHLWQKEKDEYVQMACFSGFPPVGIIYPIRQELETDCIPEQEPQFYGFDTDEEWDLAMQESADVAEAKFYTNVIKFINGQPNDIQSGTTEMTRAEIARDLVAANPDLVQPKFKAELLKSTNDVYMAELLTTIRLQFE